MTSAANSTTSYSAQLNLVVDDSSTWQEAMDLYAKNFGAWSDYRKAFILKLIKEFPTWKDIQNASAEIDDVIMCAWLPHTAQQGMYRKTAQFVFLHRKNAHLMDPIMLEFKPEYTRIKAIIVRVYESLKGGYAEFAKKPAKLVAEVTQAKLEEMAATLDETHLTPHSRRSSLSSTATTPIPMSALRNSKIAKKPTPVLDSDDEDNENKNDEEGSDEDQDQGEEGDESNPIVLYEDNDDPESDEDDDDTTPKCISFHLANRLKATNLPGIPPLFEHLAGKHTIAPMMALQGYPMMDTPEDKGTAVVCVPTRGQRGLALKEVVAYGKQFYILLPTQFLNRVELTATLPGLASYQFHPLPADVRLMYASGEDVIFRPSFWFAGKPKPKPLVHRAMDPSNPPSRNGGGDETVAVAHAVAVYD